MCSIFEEILIFQLDDSFPLHVELELLHFDDLDQFIFSKTVEISNLIETFQLVFGVEQFLCSLVFTIWGLPINLIIIDKILRVFLRLWKGTQHGALPTWRPQNWLGLDTFLTCLALSQRFLNLFGIDFIFLTQALRQLPGHFLPLWQLAVLYYVIKRPGNNLLAAIYSHCITKICLAGYITSWSVLGMRFWNSDDLRVDLLVVLLDPHHFLC